jgi:hypothetical protein
MSQAELAERVAEIGRPMSGPVVSKTEKLDRRMDVDDLIAFAAALNTTPNRLLLQGSADRSEEIDLTPGMRVPAFDAWHWATGEVPLGFYEDPRNPGSQLIHKLFSVDEDQLTVDVFHSKSGWKFHQENRPHDVRDERDFRINFAEIERHPDIAAQLMNVAREAVRHGLDALTLFAALEAFVFTAKTEKAREESRQDGSGGLVDGQG